MRLYVEVARRTYARISTYRSATVAGVFTNTVFGFLLAYVLLAVYSERDDGRRASTALDTVTFTFVAQGLLMVLGLFDDTEIADRITSGDVIVDLQRPYDHQAWWASGRLRQGRLLPALPRHPAVRRRARSCSTCRCRRPGARPRLPGERRPGHRGGVRLALPAPADGVLAPRRARTEPARVARRAVPLRAPSSRSCFFPDLARDACAGCCPFASMLQVPVEVWLGPHEGRELVLVFALQLAWVGRRSCWRDGHVMSRAVRRVVVQGG